MIDVSLGAFCIRDVQVRVKHEGGSDVMRIEISYQGSHLQSAEPFKLYSVFRFERELWENLSQKHRAEMIQDEVKRALSHEIDEWLRIDGELVTEPHPELRAMEPS